MKQGVRAPVVRTSVSLAITVALILSMLIQLVPPASKVLAAPQNGVLTALFINGRMDVDGDGVITASDDSAALLQDTAIVDGGLDCNAGAGNAGDGAITGADDCTIVTQSGASIEVVDGVFGGGTPLNGRIGLTFQTPDADWAAITGRIDANGDGVIDENDCTLNLANTVDVVAVDGTGTNPCEGLITGQVVADNGKVDVNGDRVITAADDCTMCLFGYGVVDGVVQDVVATSTGHTGLLSSLFINGRMDVNGDMAITSGDDSTALFVNTNVIDGLLDCSAGAGNLGDGVINAADDCTLVTEGGGTIQVVDGVFGGGPPLNVRMLLSYSTPDADWGTLNGRVDTNGDGMIDQDDCTLNLSETIDVIAVDGIGMNLCEGLVTGQTAADNGKVDINGDRLITTADDCAVCIFGHAVVDGLVQPLTAAGAPPAGGGGGGGVLTPSPTPSPTASATASPTATATATAPAGCTVTPNSPYQPGLNAAVTQGVCTPAQAASIAQAAAGRQVLALWLFSSGSWKFYLPANPAVAGGMPATFPSPAAVYIVLG